MPHIDAVRGVLPLPGLKDRTAVVVGGTRGVGAAVAAKLAASGVQVHVSYAGSDEDARALTARLDELPGSVVTHRGDATDPDTVPALLAAVDGGVPDIVVHAVPAGRPMPASEPRIAELCADTGRALVPLAATLRPAAGMAAGGRVVAISSSLARHATPGMAGMSAAKAALESLVRHAAVELAPRGVTVNAVATSKIDKGPATVLPEVAERLAARTPAGRLTRPEDVADVVALLCLPEAGWITGQVVTADGGLGLLS